MSWVADALGVEALDVNSAMVRRMQPFVVMLRGTLLLPKFRNGSPVNAEAAKNWAFAVERHLCDRANEGITELFAVAKQVFALEDPCAARIIENAARISWLIFCR